MSSAASVNAPPVPAVQRYFEVSLFLLVTTGILAVVLNRQTRPRFADRSGDSARLQRLPHLARPRPGNFRARRDLVGACLFSVFPARLVGFFAQLVRRRAEPGIVRRIARRYSPDAFCRRSCACIRRARIAITRSWRCWRSRPCWRRRFSRSKRAF